MFDVNDKEFRRQRLIRAGILDEDGGGTIINLSCDMVTGPIVEYLHCSMYG